jgi:hypothetical protein
MAPRTVAAAIDVSCTISLALIGPEVVGAGFWASTGVAALVYYSLSTILTGASLGTRAVDLMRQRMPWLFAVRGRAHAYVITDSGLLIARRANQQSPTSANRPPSSRGTAHDAV